MTNAIKERLTLQQQINRANTSKINKITAIKADKTLSKAQKTADIELVRTEPILVWEKYQLAKRTLTHKTVITHKDVAPLSLEEFLDAVYKSTSGYVDRGFTSLMYKRNDKVLQAIPHPKYPSKFEQVQLNVQAVRSVRGIDELLKYTHTRRTLYYTLQTFNQLGRAKENISQLHACYTDLDYYKEGLSFDEVMEAINFFVQKELIPRPSFLVDSGRGIYIIWLLHDSIASKKALRLYDKIQDEISDLFKDYGADDQAKGANGYLRLPGTYHPISKSKVTIVQHDVTARYTLGQLEDMLLPERENFEKQKLKKQKESNSIKKKITDKKKRNGLSQAGYNICLQKDLYQLLLMRGFELQGYRSFWLMIMHHSMLRSGIPDHEVMRRIHYYNNRFRSSLSETEVDSLVKSSQKRFNQWKTEQSLIKMLSQAASDEEKVNIREQLRKLRGNYKRCGYNFKSERLINIFKIKPSEYEHLTVIAPDEVRNERKKTKRKENYEKENEVKRNKRRNKKGLTNRQAQKEKNIENIRTLLEQGLTAEIIADNLQITKRYVNKIISENHLNHN
ncbi:primase C-terminal domain-containing protein [Psychrobacillus sp. NPDC093180]|uniref:primase C-terminal domain-containing protein n=1 Tax=Psychrobacillus sp. NPDC093180 TaxID=3364489 RepID=UPI003816065B